jgi:excisionase family DNA binding protein
MWIRLGRETAFLLLSAHRQDIIHKLEIDILRKLRIMRKMAKQTSHEELTTKQVAEALKLSHDTIIRMIKSGKISARRKNPLGGRTSAFLIPASEIERIKKLSQAIK